jgi:hypothetical protein
LSQEGLDPIESRLLEESMRSDYKDVDIRLRKGNYQYDMAEGIASFQLELRFPDVKDIIERLYSKEKADDQQFVRKIQTILKKMENNNVVRILPKKKPWELQRYAISSFKFIDVDKKPIVLTTTEQIDHARNLLNSRSSSQMMPPPNSNIKINILLCASIIATAYIAVLWSLVQPVINPIVFVPAFYTAVVSSLILGKLYANYRSTK